MRLIGKNKELNKKWRPILRGWLKGLPDMPTCFSVKLLPEDALGGDSRGELDIITGIIHLPVGRNDIEEIKFCFFHEVKHWLQLSNGTLSISTWVGRKCGFERRLEIEANKFAMQYQPYRNKWILNILLAWGIKK